MPAAFFIVGGAGFIGSHFTDHLLGDAARRGVTLYDNFSSGREWHYAQHAGDARLRVVRGEVEDLEALRAAMDGHDVVIHLASNPDIARAATEPDVDFWQGTALTHNVVEAMRTTSAKRILYASGSGVYGDLGTRRGRRGSRPAAAGLDLRREQAGRRGADLAATRSCSASPGCAFRFGNVVGPRQTHGVGFDFARRLLARRPTRCASWATAARASRTSTSRDVVRAVLLAHERHAASRSAAFNVATGDYITVTRDRRAGGRVRGPAAATSVRFEFTGGDRGWKGDVPVVRLDTAPHPEPRAGAAHCRRARRCASRSWPCSPT